MVRMDYRKRYDRMKSTLEEEKVITWYEVLAVTVGVLTVLWILYKLAS